MAADTVDVLVVGAGPTGLLLAGDLAAAGVPVTVLERRQGDSDTSRDCVVHARTLELLDARGIADDLIAGGRTVDHWFDPASFTDPTPGTFGNLGMQSNYGPGIANLDLSLFKNINLTERFTLQIRFKSVYSMLAQPLLDHRAATRLQPGEEQRGLDLRAGDRQPELGRTQLRSVHRQRRAAILGIDRRAHAR